MNERLPRLRTHIWRFRHLGCRLSIESVGDVVRSRTFRRFASAQDLEQRRAIRLRNRAYMRAAAHT